jgi:hypothetical protein
MCVELEALLLRGFRFFPLSTTSKTTTTTTTTTTTVSNNSRYELNNEQVNKIQQNI